MAPAARSSGLVGCEGRARAGHAAPGSGRQLDGAAGEKCPALLVGIAGRQRDLDPGVHLGDPGGDLDQREPDRVELGVAPERGLGRQAAQRVQQPVGGGVDQQAELVGRGAGAGGPVGGEVQLVRLDQVLGLAALAVDALVEPARRAGEVGDDEAAVAALGRGLDAGDDLTLDLPALGGVAELAEAADLVGLALRPGRARRPRRDRRPWPAGPGCRRGRRRSRRGCARTRSWPRAGRSGCRRGPGCRPAASGRGWPCTTWRRTSATSAPPGVLPGRRITATGLPVVAS